MRLGPRCAGGRPERWRRRSPQRSPSPVRQPWPSRRGRRRRSCRGEPVQWCCRPLTRIPLRRPVSATALWSQSLLTSFARSKFGAVQESKGAGVEVQTQGNRQPSFRWCFPKSCSQDNYPGSTALQPFHLIQEAKCDISPGRYASTQAMNTICKGPRTNSEPFRRTPTSLTDYEQSVTEHNRKPGAASRAEQKTCPPAGRGEPLSKRSTHHRTLGVSRGQCPAACTRRVRCPRPESLRVSAARTIAPASRQMCRCARLPRLTRPVPGPQGAHPGAAGRARCRTPQRRRLRGRVAASGQACGG